VSLIFSYPTRRYRVTVLTSSPQRLTFANGPLD
jgi:hypothetical protein